MEQLTLPPIAAHPVPAPQTQPAHGAETRRAADGGRERPPSGDDDDDRLRVVPLPGAGAPPHHAPSDVRPVVSKARQRFARATLSVLNHVIEEKQKSYNGDVVENHEDTQPSAQKPSNSGTEPDACDTEPRPERKEPGRKASQSRFPPLRRESMNKPDTQTRKLSQSQGDTSPRKASLSQVGTSPRKTSVSHTDSNKRKTSISQADTNQRKTSIHDPEAKIRKMSMQEMKAELQRKRKMTFATVVNMAAFRKIYLSRLVAQAGVDQPETEQKPEEPAAPEELPDRPRFVATLSPEAQFAALKAYEDVLVDKLQATFPERRNQLCRVLTPISRSVSLPLEPIPEKPPDSWGQPETQAGAGRGEQPGAGRGEPRPRRPPRDLDERELRRKRRLTVRFQAGMEILDKLKSSQGLLVTSPRIADLEPVSSYNAWTHKWAREFSLKH